jgi:hypothetical protein
LLSPPSWNKEIGWADVPDREVTHTLLEMWFSKTGVSGTVKLSRNSTIIFAKTPRPADVAVIRDSAMATRPADLDRGSRDGDPSIEEF